MKSHASLLLAGCLSLLPFSLFADEVASESIEVDAEKHHITYEGQTYLLMRPESIPVENFADSTDPYLEGYIQALVDMHYHEYRVEVQVRNHKVFLSNMPKNPLVANSIIAFVKDIPSITSVEVVPQLSAEEEQVRQRYVETPREKGTWFPQTTELFQPLVADPRQVTFGAAYRGGDRVIGKKAIAVSIGDDFPIYRWHNVFRWHGELQISIEACVFPVFNFSNVPDNNNNNACELVNADYYAGLPLTYAVDKWSFRFRFYHISSHLGDEFIVNNPQYLTQRVNPSFEAIDFFTSYQFNRHVRVYGGPGVVVHSDNSFKLKPLYVQYGAEFRFRGYRIYKQGLYGTPFIAFHFENWQQHHWNIDIFARIGYEWSKLQGIGRKFRFFGGWHYGYSYEGQFFNMRTQYGEVGISWGF